jgi:hypothetical protein
MTILRAGMPMVLIAVLSGGCGAYKQATTPFPGYGNSVRQNSAVMIIDPQPASAANTQIDFDGRKAGIAIERYREGKVIPPLELRTSEVLSEGEE